MIGKLLVLGVVLFLLVGGISFLNNNKESIEKEKKIFQGPVPQGYDLEHFRKTGETILLNSATLR